MLPAQTVRVRVECEVDLTIRDPDVIVRFTGPEGDEMRRTTYGYLKTENDVLEHLAFNAVVNGVERVNRLDGWADLPSDAATMTVDSLTFEAEVVENSVAP